MTAKIDKTGAAITRRRALQRAGFAGVAAAFGGLPLMRSARATDITLRWWSPQSAPAQLAAYKFQIAQFEAANPGVKVVFEPTSDETYPAQMASAYASGQVPDVVTHIPSFSVASYYAKGLVEPFDDVIKAIGPEKYYEGANQTYKAGDGHFTGTGIGNTAVDNLWVRKDLMKKASIDKIPDTWDELRTAAKKMQGGGIYGVPLPFAKNSATSFVVTTLIHGAGGLIFTPDLQVAIDSDATANALEFYKSLRELAPPGATSYSWGELITAFVSGATATGYYAGRVLVNVSKQNPSIADQITCAQYPTDLGERAKEHVERLPQRVHSEGHEELGGCQEIRGLPVRAGRIHQATTCSTGPHPAGSEADRYEPGLYVRPDHQQVSERNRPDDGECGQGVQHGLRESCTQAEH